MQLENKYQCSFVFTAVVLGEDDHRMKWRDSCCPLDVTTATNVLTHRYTLSFRKQTSKRNTPTQMSFHYVLLHFFAAATVIHADEAFDVSFKIATFESVIQRSLNQDQLDL